MRWRAPLAEGGHDLLGQRLEDRQRGAWAGPAGGAVPLGVLRKAVGGVLTEPILIAGGIVGRVGEGEDAEPGGITAPARRMGVDVRAVEIGAADDDEAVADLRGAPHRHLGPTG